jgi:tetratricopeptide (TPR) repeat protein
MSESKEQRIARLLNEGLEHYGTGEVAEAILAWEEVLVLDPQNPDARDYVQTADRRKYPRPAKQGSVSSAVKALSEEARQLTAGSRFEDALELLRSAAEADPSSLELQAALELVRSRLLREYRERVGDLDALPVLKASADAITKFNLPSDAGFLLSLVDGSTSVAELVSLSGMDAFEALRTFWGLLETGIVGLDG